MRHVRALHSTSRSSIRSATSTIAIGPSMLEIRPMIPPARRTVSPAESLSRRCFRSRSCLLIGRIKMK